MPLPKLENNPSSCFSSDDEEGCGLGVGVLPEILCLIFSTLLLIFIQLVIELMVSLMMLAIPLNKLITPFKIESNNPDFDLWFNQLPSHKNVQNKIKETLDQIARNYVNGYEFINDSEDVITIPPKTEDDLNKLPNTIFKRIIAGISNVESLTSNAFSHIYVLKRRSETSLCMETVGATFYGKPLYNRHLFVDPNLYGIVARITVF